MPITSGSYTITSDAYQTVAKLNSNTLNTPITLVAASGADNETWIVKTFADGTFTVKNKGFNSNEYATAATSAGSTVTDGDGIHWKQDGTAITVSGLAWEASNGKIILNPRDPNNSNQSFTFASA